MGLLPIVIGRGVVLLLINNKWEVAKNFARVPVQLATYIAVAMAAITFVDAKTLTLKFQGVSCGFTSHGLPGAV